MQLLHYVYYLFQLLFINRFYCYSIILRYIEWIGVLKNENYNFYQWVIYKIHKFLKNMISYNTYG